LATGKKQKKRLRYNKISAGALPYKNKEQKKA
jgi:hypothetical protein